LTIVRFAGKLIAHVRNLARYHVPSSLAHPFGLAAGNARALTLCNKVCYEAPPIATGLFVLWLVPDVIGLTRGENMTSLKEGKFATPIDLYRVISRVWSGDTASPTGAWSPSNPAQNHCSVTALVVQDVFGGDILCTRTVGGTHFYNVVDSKKWDITVSQFREPIPYDDTASSRDAALADTSPEKYALLRARLEAETGAFTAAEKAAK
jgi:hypothetical protein